MAIGPLVVLMVVGQWPPEVAGSHGCLLADRCSALVAAEAEEGVDLGFDDGLDDQTGARAGDVFEDLDEVVAVGEQGVDFGADGLGGDTRRVTGVGLLRTELGGSARNLRP
ncbi:hypothetical protein [Planomonospora sp. ID82291]|uniref:hypothetical protein n=1 Tax=Planomonospora sp. ID82291 TaxID=2738136 RepID=UPI0018C3B1F1|nr:hypothetical protein [Planomonospora sp. ID82291]MBG0814248.1 hypothetical protein [Planomonospora sp. ID82291]